MAQMATIFITMLKCLNMSHEFETPPSEEEPQQKLNSPEDIPSLDVTRQEAVQEIRESILELWDQLPEEEQQQLLVKQLREIMTDDDGNLSKEMGILIYQLAVQDKDTTTELAGRLLPINQVAEATGYSIGRLRDLARSGRLRALNYRIQVVSGVFTSVEEVVRYANSLRSPQEYGVLGAKKRWKDRE